MRRLPILVLSLVFAAPAAQAQDVSPMMSSYRLEEHGASFAGSVDRTTVFLSLDGRWIAERSRHDRLVSGDARSHDWIDSAACPQLVDALRDLSQVPAPRFAGPDVKTYTLVDDGTELTITGYSASANPSDVNAEERLSVSQFAGAYVTWWDKSQKALAGCWKADAPVSKGKPVAAMLAEKP